MSHQQWNISTSLQGYQKIKLYGAEIILTYLRRGVFLIWEKLTISENFTMAMSEYAWTSFNDNAKIFKCAPQGKVNEKRFHPTQKPVELYAWIFKHYAKPCDKILDTHLGSGSSRIAAYDAGFEFVGFEIDKTYFDLQEERFEKHTAKMNLFVNEQ